MVERINRLVTEWRLKGHVEALHIFLAHWPIATDVTQEWTPVCESLETVRNRATTDFSAAEQQELDRVLVEVRRIARRC